MNKTATLVLNRNLPDITNTLYESLQKHNGDLTDLYVIESGSSKDKLSKYCSFWANWEESLAHGLRYPRGFNYGLLQLLESKKYDQYDYFFLVCNDSVFEPKPIVGTLLQEMTTHPRVGILSPCSEKWGERSLLKDQQTKYFWHINHVAWFVRRSYIDSVRQLDNPTHLNFLYDGDNFRGYESDIELIAKGYANDWASAVTSKVRVEENEDLLKTRFEAMKTDDFRTNREKVFQEGNRWLRRKYGFNHRWTMQMYAKFFYDKFFEFYPQLSAFKI